MILPESWAAAAYCDIWEEKDLGRLESAACRSAAWAAVRFLGSQSASFSKNENYGIFSSVVNFILFFDS